MKIAFIIENFDPARGGAETYLADFIRFLQPDKHDIHVFTESRKGCFEGVTFHKITPKGLFKSRRALHFAAQCEAELKKEKFDIIQSLGRTWYMNVYQPHGGVTCASRRQNLMAAGSPAAKAVKYLSWAFSPKSLMFFLVERRVLSYRLPLKVVALSKMVKGHLKEFYDVPDENIAVIYNGVDTEKFSPRVREIYREKKRKEVGICNDEVVLMVAAHNFRLKGVIFLIYLGAELKARGLDKFKILVVGKGKQAKYIRMAQRLSTANNVIFTGAVDDVVLYYACADIYCHPTFYDPCSLVVLEALAMGLPVITTAFNGAGELITEGKEGFILSRPNQVQKMADIVMELTDANRRDEMGRAARALAEGHSLSHHVRKMTALYEEVMALEKKNG